MSLITGDPEDSPRDCSRSSSRPHKHHHHHHHGNRRRRRAIIAVSSTAASLLSLALILWLTLRPSSPSFSLLAATATVSNASAAPIITVDAALTAHNPNAHATALYDQLQATASYAGVPLSGAAPLMPTPLEQPEGDVVLSAMLTSSSAWTWTSTSPSPPDRALLRVRIQGQLRWKVAAWVSATHGLTVDCIAAVLLQASAIPLPPGQGQLQQQGASFPSQSQSQSQCATNVQ
ncbi:hypothetical protein BDA96_04G000600 [Sorghum bicolor]|jgi:hypothetical protein|uniref:Late embryogenesis abundant protein LEA-2 subgroup domain-containing protein n=2 Tax=Sorghum bicolor TaxID=4558 RepID=A0A921R0Q9_SORBI|nr:uncharacterized protein LOC8066465 [Sorghum bicolor]KAG0531168.1 hypothetical protein BDA96_04G000600 [Sorghum bicolor]OQU84133.1 hypothetical protein SORBI_3004G000601 [Sorghum bicolor]|eukprot:XP_002451335.2 uncharacterized protein LOC8066465 [Sorghum bicolor]